MSRFTLTVGVRQLITKLILKGYRIYKVFELNPNPKLNLIIGNNESGKSTLLEAISLALTGRVNGKWASEELNPYWFNVETVRDFIKTRESGVKAKFPEISIELFFEGSDDLQILCGAHNTDIPTNACPGITFKVVPNTEEFNDELEQWVDSNSGSEILPTDYYKTEWTPFHGRSITRRPKELATVNIDSRTVRSTSGVDYHLNQILNEHLDVSERVAISEKFRRIKATMTHDSFSDVNSRIERLNACLHDKPISLAMDQSSRTKWEGSVTPHVAGLPFSVSGQGQQASIKISLAMSKHSERARFVTIEEPENHLSHTSLTTLLSRLQTLAGEQQQIFISTHSSYVLNRLGLNSLLLLGGSDVYRIPELNPETVSYFKKLPGYDTLRLVLASKIVLVEGPSDEIIFERVFRDRYGKMPMEFGVDVLSMRGISLRKCLELCSCLDKTVAALRDNDGLDPADLINDLLQWLESGKRELFIGDPKDGRSLESQILACNGENVIRSVLGVTDRADLSKWMTREKTEAAIRIAESTDQITPPDYIAKAVEFIHD